MSWLGLLLAGAGLYLAFKLAGALLKLLMWILVLAGAYWLAAPHLGWPSISDLFYVLGPDFEGRRIEAVMPPSDMARNVADGVVDRVAAQAAEAVEGAFDQAPRGSAAPQPLPEDAPDVRPGPQAGQALETPVAR